MPACFQLFPKGSTTPARFSDIDDAMCAHFGVNPDPDRYYRQWYDTEGFRLAIGHSLASQREESPERADIIDWLDANYSPESWYER